MYQEIFSMGLHFCTPEQRALTALLKDIAKLLWSRKQISFCTKVIKLGSPFSPGDILG
jgi:hypothetical protein